MKTYLRPAATILVLMTLVTGLAYPLLVTLVAQVVFPHRANGSIILNKEGKAVGSELIGQYFDDPGFFWSRPSGTGPVQYTAFNAEKGTGSTGTNYGPLNESLYNPNIDPAKLKPGQLHLLTEEESKKLGIVQQRVHDLLAADPDNKAPIPVDLVTASASGLDPHISPAAAEYQVNRVAKARGLTAAAVRQLVAKHTEGRTLGVLGEPRVNVLLLNLELAPGKDKAP